VKFGALAQMMMFALRSCFRFCFLSSASFEYGFNEWHADGTTLSNDFYNSADCASCDKHSAKLGNGKGKKIDKTYLEQSVLWYTPQGTFDVSFCYKASPDWTPGKSAVDVQFNHVELNSSYIDEYMKADKIYAFGSGDDELHEGVDFIGPFPLDLSVKNNWTDWTCVELVATVPTEHITADLRIRFHGHGFLIDLVTVKDVDDHENV
jgi:hypothetical protein